MAPDSWDDHDPEIELLWRRLLEEEKLAPSLLDELDDDLVRTVAALPHSIDAPDALGAYLTHTLGESSQRADAAERDASLRLRLHRQAKEEIGYQILCCQSSLKAFTGWGLGYNTGVDVKRNFLEKQLADLRRERRALEIRAFDDLRTLRRELRDMASAHERAYYRLSLMDGGKGDGE
ncbi:MAG TPA: hypothetical protein QGH10_27045 [Armatimonadota bacterium]|jgi:hypothetical protein|nr:hypothetical protein [Armatimonadota bacterium]